MKTIIYIIPALINSGPVNVLYNIVKYIDRSKYDPIVVALYKHKLKDRDNTSDFEKLGVKVITYNFSKWELELKTKQIARIIESSFDKSVIFHAHGYHPTLLLSYLSNKKTVNTIHNICDEDFINEKGFLLGSYMANRYKKNLKSLAMCVAISDSMNLYYSNRIKETSFRTVYNGVSVECCNKNRKRLCHELNISLDIKLLFFPAAFNRRKNHSYLIEELLRSKRNDFLVLFAGQGEFEEKCKQLVANDSRFHFLGFQNDLSFYWSAVDFMISSSVSEGLPMAVLEAVVRGIPCILSDILPHKEIVNNVFGTDSNLLFSLNSQGSLCYTVERLLDLPFDRKNIQEKAIKFYSAEAMAHGYELIYENII